MVQHSNTAANQSKPEYHYRSVSVDKPVTFNNNRSAATSAATATATSNATMPSSAVSDAIAAEPANNEKRTYDEQGQYDGDDDDNDNDGDDSDKNSVSGLAAFFHYARAHHKQVRTMLMGSNATAAKTMGANVTFGKVAEELAKKYKALPATMITVYQEEAAKSDVDFVKEMKPFSVPTRTRKKKDPDAPKGALSSYFHYMMATRTKISAENPDMGFGAVTRECALRFKDLTGKDRQQWEEKAVTDKIRYKEQMEVYEKEQEAKKKPQEEAGDEKEETKKPSKKAKKNPAQEQDKEKTLENAGDEKEDPAGEADKPKKKNKRKTLTGEQKAQEKEDDKPNKAKKSHAKEHDKGKAHESAGNEKDDVPKEDKSTKKSKKKTLTGDQKTVEKEDDHTKAEKPKKKEKRPADAPTWYKSGYTLFMEANRDKIREANPGMAHSEVSKLGSTNFKALSAFDQQMWMIQATADKARFDREMEVYNSKQKGATKDK
jgi:hypothetical protein